MAQGTGHSPNLLADLTPAQLEAVTHLEGPLLVLAGPGSGKTRVITRRIVYLIQHHCVSPKNILAVTFTNKAAGEMRERVHALLPDSLKLDGKGVEVPPNRLIRIRTFHSFGAETMRIHADRIGIDRNFTIYDQDDRKKVLKEAIALADVAEDKFTPDQIGGAISKAKNRLVRPDAYQYAMRANDFFGEVVARVYAVYERRMRAANAVDFDDLLLMPALALRSNEELRSELDARFRYILIDEYQDTNGAQYEIARRLSVNFPNICVVGDPDQSIYKFRGSDIKNILDFERDFPTAKTIALEKNYRSTKAILRAAGAVIDHNKQRKKKSLVTDNPAGEPVHVLTFNDGLEEADQVAARIRAAAVDGKRNYRDFAIFLRTNALSRSLESAFIKHGVPYQMVRGLAFYDRKENKDVLAYLRLLVNPKDNVSFVRAIGEPTRGVGKTSLEHLQTYAESRGLSLLEATAELSKIPAIKGKAATGLKEFAVLMSSLRESLGQPPDEVVRRVLERSGYRAMLKMSKSEEDEERLENVEEMITAAGQFAREDPDRTIGDFLETITLASDVDGWDERQDCVSVMTLHAAKGLEFPVVYMLAVEHGLLPHARSLEQEDEVEEERRLCFVGMTRAKEELYLCNARYREFGGRGNYCIPSHFLEELPADVERDDQSSGDGGTQTAANLWRGCGSAAARGAWRDTGFVAPRPRKDENGLFVGALVEHADYGTGQIVDLSGFGSNRVARVRFNSGVKVFYVNRVKLTVVREE